MKWSGEEKQKDGLAAEGVEDAGEKENKQAEPERKQEGGRGNEPWHRNIMNLKLEENRGNDLIEVDKGAVALGEVNPLSWWVDAQIKGNEETTTARTLNLLRLEENSSRSLYGSQHSTGLMFQFHTTVRKIWATRTLRAAEELEPDRHCRSNYVYHGSHLLRRPTTLRETNQTAKKSSSS